MNFKKNKYRRKWGINYVSAVSQFFLRRGGWGDIALIEIRDHLKNLRMR